jgi:hypothetical protein
MNDDNKGGIYTYIKFKIDMMIKEYYENSWVADWSENVHQSSTSRSVSACLVSQHQTELNKLYLLGQAARFQTSADV